MMLAPAPGKAASWMVAMESQLQAVKVMSIATASPSKNQDIWKFDLKMLLDAAPFMWSVETIQAVLAASRSIPLETTIDSWNIDTNAVWWYFNNPLPFEVAGAEVTRTAFGIRALCMAWAFDDRNTPPRTVGFKPSVSGIRYLCCSVWTDDSYEFEILPSQAIVWAEKETLQNVINGSRKSYEKRHPDSNHVDVYTSATEGVARFILAGLAWLGQKVIVESGGHIERHRRKDFNRKTGQTLSTVRVISLRKSDHTPREASSANCRCGHAAFDHLQGRNGLESCAECGCEKFEVDKVEWSCRWTVDGHWRNQPVGVGHHERRLTWINPYVKGPDDKELRVPRRKVYVVNR